MRRVALLLVGLCLSSSPAAAAWAHVQSTINTPNAAAAGTVAQAFASDVTSGSLLVATVSWYSAGGETITGAADGKSQTWVKAGSTRTVSSVGGNWSVEVWYFANAAATSGAGERTVTATFSAATATYRGIAIGEYSGIATSSPLDQTTGKAQVDVGTTTDATTSDPVTTTANNELIYSGSLVAQISGAQAGGTSFTRRTSATDGAFSYLATEDRNLASAGSVAGTWTAAGAGDDAATIVATFKEPGAGAATPRGLLLGVGP